MARLHAAGIRSSQEANAGMRASAPLPARPPTTSGARTTRSQSREPAAQPSATTQEQKSGRVRARAGRQASVESAQSAEDRPSRVRGGAKEKPKAVQVIAPETIQEETEEVDHSNLSGPTALSSASDQEVAELDRDLVLSEAVALYENADKVLDIIAPKAASLSRLESVLVDVRKPASKDGKLLSHRERSFAVQLDVFGRNKDHPYIKPPVVMRALFAPRPVPTQDPRTWKIEEIIYKANLASFAHWVVSSEREAPSTWNLVRMLDQTFPAPFLSSFIQFGPSASVLAVGSSKLLDDTFRLGLELRTQVAIVALSINEREPNFDPDEKLREVFFLKTGDTNQPQVRGWQTKQLGGGNADLHPEYQKLIANRMGDISRFINKDASVDIGSLSVQYRWSSFALRGLLWSSLRNEEISSFVQARGGARHIVEQLGRSIESSQSVPAQSDEMVGVGQAEIATQAEPKKLGQSKRAAEIQTTIEFLRRNADLLPPRDSTSGKTGPTVAEAEVASEEVEMQQLEVESVEDPLEPEAPLADMNDPVAYRFSQFKARDKANKENSSSQASRGFRKPRAFIDRQDHAERVDWDSQAATLPPSSAIDSSSRAKRAAHIADEDDDEDDDEDEGFERDDRQMAIPVRRAGPTSRVPRRTKIGRTSPKRVRTEAQPQLEGDETQSEEERTGSRRNRTVASQTSTGRPENRQRQPSSSRQPPASNYTQIRATAREKVAAHRVPRRQHRVRWTEAEENALIDYIERLGCRWSQIKHEDGHWRDNPASGEMEWDGPGFLRNRDQVALKDKARNMRFDYIKSGMALPQNFEDVTLSAAQRQRLADMGIDV